MSSPRRTAIATRSHTPVARCAKLSADEQAAKDCYCDLFTAASGVHLLRADEQVTTDCYCDTVLIGSRYGFPADEQAAKDFYYNTGNIATAMRSRVNAQFARNRVPVVQLPGILRGQLLVAAPRSDACCPPWAAWGPFVYDERRIANALRRQTQ